MYRTLVDCAKIGDLRGCRQALRYINDINMDKRSGVKPLHWAVSGGHVECVRFLLEKHADPRVLTTDKNTPLHIASYCGQSECIQILLSYNVPIHDHFDHG